MNQYQLAAKELLVEKARVKHFRVMNVPLINLLAIEEKR
jgi:hypothetical protein